MMKPACALLVLCWGALAQATPMNAKLETDIAGAIDELAVAAQNNGYQLVKVQPIDQALVKRGYPDPGVRIVFIGNASDMQQAMKTDPRLLSLLPLRLTLIVEGDRTIVSSDDLDIWKEMFPSPESEKLIEGWQRSLNLILSDFSAP